MDAAVADPPVKRVNKRYLSPGKRITPKQQRYAELLATGMPQAHAAKHAGYKSKCSANDAYRHPLVQEYLSTIRNRAAARTGHTVVVAMEEANGAMAFARETENATAYVKAVELRAKLSGLLIDRVEVVSMDLKGALAMAELRIVNVPALIQTPQADQQTDERNRVNP